MAKEKKLAKDFDLFGDLSEKPPVDPAAPEIPAGTEDIPNDIFGLGSAEPKKDEPAPEKEKEEPKKEEEPKPEDELPTDEKETPNPEEPKKSDAPLDTSDEENEIEKLIREAWAGLEAIKNDPEATPDMLKKIQEATDLNDELAAKVESLTRQLETAREQNNKNLETGEEMRIYEPMIQKLEKDPQLMILAKHYGTKNETMKTRLTDIVKDMLHSLTGIDVYALMDDETKSKATAFGEENPEATPPAIDPPKKEEQAPGYRRPKDKTFSL